jgi:hypothetical protein
MGAKQALLTVQEFTFLPIFSSYFYGEFILCPFCHELFNKLSKYNFYMLEEVMERRIENS